jgi:hypothetical protein
MNRRLVLASLALCTAFALALPASAQDAAKKAPKQNSSGGNSPHETTSAVIGGRGGPRVIISYGRPYSKDPKTGEMRKIWGTLVPWGKAWRLGSDEATTLLTSLPMVIGETTIEPGAYALYLVPMENEATKLVFSSNYAKWGIPVDEKHDIARVDLKKATIEQSVDQLTINVANDASTPNSGVIKITWENTQFSLPFTLKK